MSDIIDAADIKAIADARQELAVAITQSGTDELGKTRKGLAVVNVSSLSAVLDELDRAEIKLDEITKGKTTLFMSDADRARSVVELCDDALVKWARWVLLNIQSSYDRKAEEDGKGTQVITAMHGVVSLALMAINMNAGHAKFTVDGVTFRGEEKGDWQVIVQRKGEQYDRKALASALADPGATEGYKGDRSLTEWQMDALMRVLDSDD